MKTETAIRAKGAPDSSHYQAAADFFTDNTVYLADYGDLIRCRNVLADLLAKRDRELSEKFDKALSGIGRTLPDGFCIENDLDGNYRVAKTGS